MKQGVLSKIVIACLILFLSEPLMAQAELERHLSDYRIDSLKTKELRLDFDNLFFFKNNEFGNSVMKGYTLPGAWVRGLPEIGVHLGEQRCLSRDSLKKAYNT